MLLHVRTADPTAPLSSLFMSPELLDLASQRTHLCIERVKIFGDGSLGAETAAISLEEASGTAVGSGGGGKGHAGVREEETLVVASDDRVSTMLPTSEFQNDHVSGKSSGSGSGSGSSEALRTVKISFPASMDMDYAFQESLQEYMQLYGAVSFISFHSFEAKEKGADGCHLAEVLFQVRRLNEVTVPLCNGCGLIYVTAVVWNIVGRTKPEQGSVRQSGSLLTPALGLTRWTHQHSLTDSLTHSLTHSHIHSRIH